MRLRKYVRKSNAHTLLYGTSDMVIVYLVSCKGKASDLTLFFGSAEFHDCPYKDKFNKLKE